MKKVLLTLLVAGLSVVGAFAEELTGSVVSAADNQLTVKTDAGETVFSVIASTVIEDAEGNAVELAAIAADTQVKVEYAVTDENVNEATYVNIVNE